MATTADSDITPFEQQQGHPRHGRTKHTLIHSNPVSGDSATIRTGSSRRHSGGRRLAGWRRIHRDPRFQVVTSVLIFIVALAIAVGSYLGAAKSSETQHHGVLVTARMGYVNVDTSCSRHSCSTTFSAPLTLNRAVGGHTTSTVHGHGGENLQSDVSTQVLVDPKDPSYAEFPGYPLNNASGWEISAAIAAFFLISSVFTTRRLLRRYPGMGSLRN